MPNQNAPAGWSTETQYLYGPPPPYVLNIGDEVWFDKDMRRKGQEDILFLNMKGDVLDVETGQPVDDWEEHTLSLKTGNGWDTEDNGQTAEHPKKKYYDGRSKAGIFVDSIVNTPALKDLLKVMEERGTTPLQADSWKNISLVIDQRVDEGVIEGNRTKWGSAIVVEFRGELDAEGQAKARKSKKEATNEKLTKLAIESDDFATFRNEAMSLGVSDGKLLKDIMNEGDDGFYARTRSENGS